MKPKLASMDRLSPYLRRIDSARIYSNFGPLAHSLEERLCEHYDLGSGTVTTVANATLGLALALSAQNPQPGSLCILPAWTFVASVHAAIMAGLVPYFVDVNLEDWTLDVSLVAKEIARAPRVVGAVMPVAPFGRTIDVSQWDLFRSQSGLPVVVDAAAGFDGIKPGETPVVVSLHATKVLGVGEGGFVMSTDISLIKGVRARSNFGFLDARDAKVPSANAKLSEYHAAVGLAALDNWDCIRDQWMGVARSYRKALSDNNQIQFQDGFGASWVASTCILHFADMKIDKIENRLAADGVDSRRWWGAGAHAHRATREFPRTNLPNTEALARSTLGLPFYVDMRPSEVELVAEVIRAAI